MNVASDIKKVFLQVILLTSLFASVFIFTAVPSYAEDFEVVDHILVKYNGPGGNISIPTNVEKINPNVFLNNTKLTTVNIQEGVFEICDNAFDGCIHIQKVHFPTTLRTIGKGAFNNCLKMKELNLPKGLTTIGEGAFYGCSSFEKVTIPKSVAVLERAVFADCTNIRSFSVESGNYSYVADDGVLYTSDSKVLIACPLGRKDTSFKIPEGVEYIERNAFGHHPTLKEIIFPTSLKEIRPYAFRNCVGLREVTFPETLDCVYEHSFMYCPNLNRVYVKGKDTQTQVHAYDGSYSVTLYADEDSRAKHYADLYNMNWLPLNDTETIILPEEKVISHDD